jgi:hypothetical protein
MEKSKTLTPKTRPTKGEAQEHCGGEADDDADHRHQHSLVKDHLEI